MVKHFQIWQIIGNYIFPSLAIGKHSQRWSNTVIYNQHGQSWSRKYNVVEHGQHTQSWSTIVDHI